MSKRRATREEYNAALDINFERIGASLAAEGSTIKEVFETKCKVDLCANTQQRAGRGVGQPLLQEQVGARDNRGATLRVAFCYLTCRTST